jgi:hypothetical protein
MAPVTELRSQGFLEDALREGKDQEPEYWALKVIFANPWGLLK